jgi:hypothetical protein
MGKGVALETLLPVRLQIADLRLQIEDVQWARLRMLLA